jgi:hypothetical protein
MKMRDRGWALTRADHVASMIGLVPSQHTLPHVKSGQLLLGVERGGVNQTATAGTPPVGPLACTCLHALQNTDCS